MPELPEVETIRRGLAPVLIGRSLVRVEARRLDLRFPLPAGFVRDLTGARVSALDRLGKYLLVGLGDGRIWLIHLGMSGRLRIGGAGGGDDAEASVHDHVIATTDHGIRLVFRDPRRFGFMDLFPAADLAGHPRLAGLGPDPLGPSFSAAYLGARLAGKTAAIKVVLMDQGVVAGMGNIYASESLHRAKIAPTRAASSLTRREAGRLARAIVAVFHDAIEAGGASLRDHRRPSGELGDFQSRFAVYGRTGAPCPACGGGAAAGAGIRRIVLGGRATFYCPRCQR
jgi:formamidopyrimidine-DNA glycosylase